LRLFAEALPMPRKPSLCAICKEPIPPKDARGLRKTCRRLACRLEQSSQDRARGEKARQQRREREERLHEQMRRLRDAHAVQRHISDAEAYVPFAILSCNYVVQPLSPERREAFHSHLREIILAAFADPSATSTTELPAGVKADGSGIDDPLPILSASCATCQGSCCSDGETHAFLTADTMRRYLRKHSGAEPEELFAAYDAHVPQETCADSCVFHALSGCSLPRELRSDMCNQWDCHRLKDLRKQILEDPDRRFFVGALVQGELPRTAFLTKDGPVG
jgi:hypothetical protein